MHRADFPDEGRTKVADYPVCLNQLPPERTRRVAIVGGMLIVFGERDSGLDLIGTRDDVSFDSETVQCRERFAVKLRDRFGGQWHDPLVALTVTDGEDMVDEVELQVKDRVAVWNCGGAKWARS
jgi:hypothetical protein